MVYQRSPLLYVHLKRRERVCLKKNYILYELFYTLKCDVLLPTPLFWIDKNTLRNKTNKKD